MDVLEWDVFISHASEDKEDFVRPLAHALQAQGLKVWFDETALTVGDSLQRSIDRGLAHSRFGIVIISPSFLSKEWPQKELDGLVAREIEGVKVILPVWHRIDVAEVRRHSPMLAGRLATQSKSGVAQVVADLLQAIHASTPVGRPSRSDGQLVSSILPKWHRQSSERYAALLRDAAGDWPISLDKAHYILSFEVTQARRGES